MTARSKFLGLGWAVLLVATIWSGPVRGQSIYVDYYTPQFFMDHLVFYDEAGTPIYYEDDEAYAVPSDIPEYDELVNHFEDNIDAYFQWFEELGYDHLEYRRPLTYEDYKPKYYHGYPVFFEDDRPVYYIDGELHVISPHDARYHKLMIHYRDHRAKYRKWYRSIGRHYRWYRRPVYTDYYRPLYFDGYLVFFDDSGLPYYYRGSQVVRFPRSHARYHSFISHYRKHRDNYRKWYQAKGRRNHEYRRPKVYRKRHHAPKAPKARHGRAEHRRYRDRMLRPVKPTLRPKHRHEPRLEPERRHEPRLEPKRHEPRIVPKRHEPRLVPKRPERRDRVHKPVPPRRVIEKAKHKDKKRKKEKEKKRKVLRPPRHKR